LNYDQKKKVAVITDSSKGLEKAVTISFAKSNDYSGVITNSTKIDEAQSSTPQHVRVIIHAPF
jgi:hypothetical protein